MVSGTPTITPVAIPDGPRRRTQASTRLLHEWSELQTWEATPTYEMRLGPTPLVATGAAITPAVERMLRVSNRYADMVGVTATEVQVIEAKMVADPGAISQLQHYVRLIYTTPILQTYANRTVVGVLLFAVDDPIVHQSANAAGLRVVIYGPSWTNDYLATKYFRR